MGGTILCPWAKYLIHNADSPLTIYVAAYVKVKKSYTFENKITQTHTYTSNSVLYIMGDCILHILNHTFFFFKIKKTWVHYQGQKYFNIALVLQDEWLTTFTCPANTCCCPLKAYAIKNILKGVLWNMTSSSNFPVGRVLWEELLVLTRFHS